MHESGIMEPFLVKHWGIKLATNAAITVLRVDQVCTQIPIAWGLSNIHKKVQFMHIKMSFWTNNSNQPHGVQ